ncbi:VWA domain-containing protein [Nitratifractor sp.]|uniref:vWA domain-containing protein n=1 Tax=Nitratifractor sp. TaxID=2268144 RepID=UPI0025DFF7A3|nr:VWA domain-containing protein [Nitratifractor sp.]
MIHFAHLWVFALLPLYWWCERRCFPALPTLRLSNVQFLRRAAGGLGSRERWIRWWIVILMVTALANPVTEKVRTLHNAKGYSVALLLDASYSMREGDRFETAKRVLSDFILHRPYDRMALEVFGDRARLAAPMSYDKSGLQTILKHLHPGVAGGRDTALYEALFAGADLFEKEPKNNRVMILLTDGIDTVGSVPLETAIRRVREAGIRVYTIGVGDDFRRRVLKRIATETGGTFFDASDPKGLASIYARIDRLEKSSIATYRSTERRSYYRIPLGLAVGLLVLLLGLKIRQRRGILPVGGALLLSLLALYGPGIERGLRQTPHSGGDLLLALDASRSMKAKDLYPDRFRFALHKAKGLLSELHRTRVGVLLFTRRAWLLAPPTGDYEALRRLLDGIGLESIERKGSDWNALVKAASQLGEGNRSRVLLIFSDGEGIKDPYALARQASEANLTLFGYAAATEKGVTIPDGKGLLRDQRGDVVVTRLDPRFAETVRQSGGRFFVARNDDGDLKEIARKVEEALGERKATGLAASGEENLYWIPLLLALVIFMVPWKWKLGMGSRE